MGFFNNITGTNISNTNTVTTNTFLSSITGNIGYFNSFTGSTINYTNVYSSNLYTNNFTGNISYFNSFTGTNISFTNIYSNNITGDSCSFSSISGYTGITGSTGPTGIGITGPTGNKVIIGARCYITTNSITLLNNTITTISPWSVKVYDTNNAFNTTTGVYTIPVSGMYLISSQFLIDQAGTFTNGDAKVQVLIYLNGSTMIQQGTFYNWNKTTTNYVPVLTTGIYNFTAGDTVTVKAFQNSGTSKTIFSSADISLNIFEIQYLGSNNLTNSLIGITGSTGTPGFYSTISSDVYTQNITNVNNINTLSSTGNTSFFNNYTGINSEITNQYVSNLTGTTSFFNMYTGTNLTSISNISDNLSTYGNINITETISSAGAISTFKDTLFDSTSGSFTGTLANSSNFNQVKKVKLLYRRSNPVTVTCNRGSFDLTPSEPEKTLRYIGPTGGWEVYNPGDSLAADSFYPSKLQTASLVSSTTFAVTNMAINSAGTTLAICGSAATTGGNCFIYAYNGAWSLSVRITLTTGATGTVSNNCVALSSDGNTMALGNINDFSSVGSTWIFTRSNNYIWTQQGTKLVGSGFAGTPQQGFSVSLSADGNTLATSGRSDNSNIGAVWVFTRSNGIWTQQGNKLVGSGFIGATIQQGTSVSLSSDGNTLAVGGINDNSSIGAVWIFTRLDGIWIQQGNKLVGSGYVGSPQQGISVSLSSDGNTLAESSIADNSNNGATWIFVRINNNWTQQGLKLIPYGYIVPPFLGQVVSLSGDGNVLACVPSSGTAPAISIYIRQGGIYGGIWSFKKKIIPGGSITASFAMALNSNGTVLAFKTSSGVFIYT